MEHTWRRPLLTCSINRCPLGVTQMQKSLNLFLVEQIQKIRRQRLRILNRMWCNKNIFLNLPHPQDIRWHNCPHFLVAAKNQVSPHLWGKLLLDTFRTDRYWTEPRSRAEQTCKTSRNKMRNPTHDTWAQFITESKARLCFIIWERSPAALIVSVLWMLCVCVMHVRPVLLSNQYIHVWARQLATTQTDQYEV